MTSDSSESFQRLFRTSELVDGKVTVGRLGIKQIAVVRHEGSLYAFRNRCPHAGERLSRGRICGSAIECPRHGWRFVLEDGRSPGHPTYSLRKYDVRERDGWIEVRQRETEIW